MNEKTSVNSAVRVIRHDSIPLAKAHYTEEGYLVDNDVIDFIAQKLDTNIREMEGILSKVVFYSSLIGKSSANMDDILNERRKELFGEGQIAFDYWIDCSCSIKFQWLYGSTVSILP